MKGLRPLVLSVGLGTDCSCGVRFNSGRSFHRGGGIRELPGAEAVRTLGRGGGEDNGPDGVDGSVAEERDRMRRGGARARGTRPVSVGNNGEWCWRERSTYVDGTLVAWWGKGANGVSAVSVARVYTTAS